MGNNISVKGNNSKIGDIIQTDRSRKVVKISLGVTISIAAVIVIAIFFMKGSPESLLIGEWQTENGRGTIEFTKSGQLIIPNTAGATFTYEILEKDRLLIHVNILWGNGDVKADISIDNKTLTLSNFNDPQNIDLFDTGKDGSITFYRKN